MLVWGISIDGSVGSVSSVGIVGSVSVCREAAAPGWKVTLCLCTERLMSSQSSSTVSPYYHSQAFLVFICGLIVPNPANLSEFYASSNGVQSDILLFNRWDIAKKYEQRKMA